MTLATRETGFVFIFSVSLARAHVRVLGSIQVLLTTPTRSKALASPPTPRQNTAFQKTEGKRGHSAKISRTGVNPALNFSQLPAKGLVQRTPPWGTCVLQWRACKPLSFPWTCESGVEGTEDGERSSLLAVPYVHVQTLPCLGTVQRIFMFSSLPFSEPSILSGYSTSFHGRRDEGEEMLT